MSWETPKVVEIRMDAEIGSYQEDFDRDEDRPVELAKGDEPRGLGEGSS
jgi:hypothetical protein